jgi:hypothetical protein
MGTRTRSSAVNTVQETGVSVSQGVYEGLEAVRKSGITNMFDMKNVKELASSMGYKETIDWLDKVDKEEYARLILEGPSPTSVLTTDSFIKRLEKEGLQVDLKEGQLGEDWITTKLGNMTAQIVYFPEPSKYGIKGKGYKTGRISKLWISERGNTVVFYDRGHWDIKPPQSGMVKDFYDSIVDLARDNPRGPIAMKVSQGKEYRASAISSTGINYRLEKIEPGVKKIISACRPDYKGRKVEVSDSIPNELHSYWDEGSRNYWSIYDIETGKVRQVSSNHPFFEERSPRTLKDFFGQDKLPQNKLLVKHNIFCGEDLGITVYGNKEKLLDIVEFPRVSRQLTQNEKTVLKYTAGLKSSYGGVKNLRFKRAKERTGITQDHWDKSKEKMIEEGYLYKNGAISPKGKNTVTNEPDMYSL